MAYFSGGIGDTSLYSTTSRGWKVSPEQLPIDKQGDWIATADYRDKHWWALSSQALFSADVECQSPLSSILYPAPSIEAEVYAACEPGLWALWLWWALTIRHPPENGVEEATSVFSWEPACGAASSWLCSLIINCSAHPSNSPSGWCSGALHQPHILWVYHGLGFAQLEQIIPLKINFIKLYYIIVAKKY